MSFHDGLLSAWGSLVLHSLEVDFDTEANHGPCDWREGAGEVVIGLPLRADGTETPTSGAARRFADLLGEACGLPVILVDERFSSLEAAERMREAGVSGAKVRDRKDSEAARLILQRYLDQVAEETP